MFKSLFENQQLNQTLAMSQEIRANFDEDMAILKEINDKTPLNQLLQMKEYLTNAYELRKREGQPGLGLTTAILKVSSLIRNNQKQLA